MIGLQGGTSGPFKARSSYFDDPARFAPGQAVPDSAFLMANVDTTWRSQELLCAPGRAPEPSTV